MAVLGLLGQGNESVRLHGAAILQPNQPLEGGTLRFTQSGQPLRQGVERRKILSGLEGGKQAGELPVILYLPENGRIRRGPQPFPGVQHGVGLRG